MADTAPLVRTRTDEAFLSPGERYDIDFFPVGGPALAWAYRGAAREVFLLQKPGGPSVPAREALREVAASHRSAMAKPTLFANPCPSGPVVTSTPGVTPRSG